MTIEQLAEANKINNLREDLLRSFKESITSDGVMSTNIAGWALQNKLQHIPEETQLAVCALLKQGVLSRKAKLESLLSSI